MQVVRRKSAHVVVKPGGLAVSLGRHAVAGILHGRLVRMAEATIW